MGVGAPGAAAGRGGSGRLGHAGRPRERRGGEGGGHGRHGADRDLHRRVHGRDRRVGRRRGGADECAGARVGGTGRQCAGRQAAVCWVIGDGLAPGQGCDKVREAVPGGAGCGAGVARHARQQSGSTAPAAHGAAGHASGPGGGGVPGGAPLACGQAQAEQHEDHRQHSAQAEDDRGSGGSEKPIAGAGRMCRQRAAGCAAQPSGGRPNGAGREARRGGEHGGDDRQGQQHAGEAERKPQRTARGNAEGPGQHGEAGQRRGGAEALQEQVSADGAGQARQVARGLGGRGVQGGVVRVVAGERHQEQQGADRERDAGQLRQAGADEGADFRGGEASRLQGYGHGGVRSVVGCRSLGQAAARGERTNGAAPKCGPWCCGWDDKAAPSPGRRGRGVSPGSRRGGRRRAPRAPPPR